MRKKVIHKLYSDGGEYAYEGEFIPCDPLEQIEDPKTSEGWSGVTCKRCLKHGHDHLDPKITYGNCIACIALGRVAAPRAQSQESK